jgi:hypothetical protein
MEDLSGGNQLPLCLPDEIGNLKPTVGSAVGRAISANTFERPPNREHFPENSFCEDRIKNMDLERGSPSVDNRKAPHHPGSTATLAIGVTITIDVRNLIRGNSEIGVLEKGDAGLKF